MEGWVDLGYPSMHWPGVELATSRLHIRCPKHYTTEPPLSPGPRYAYEDWPRMIDKPATTICCILATSNNTWTIQSWNCGCRMTIYHRLLKLRTDGGYARCSGPRTWVHRFCVVTDNRCLEPTHSKLRTSNLAGMFPGVWTWPLKNFSKRGRGQGNVTPKFLENKC